MSPRERPMNDLRELLRAAAPEPPELNLDDLARRSHRPARSGARPFVIALVAVVIVALVSVAIVQTGGGSSRSPAGRSVPSASQPDAAGTAVKDPCQYIS